LRPDIVALQEITARTLPLWRESASNALAFAYFADSISRAPDPTLLRGPRRYGQIIATRLPLHVLPPDGFAIPWPERVLSVTIESSAGPVEAHTTHIPPGSSQGWKKVETLEGIHTRLARKHDGHRLLCGDFNLPRRESPNGEVFYWDTIHGKNGSLRRKRAERWGIAERGVCEGLAGHDLADAYRALHPYGARVDTWIPSQGMNENPRRFDHLFASKSLGVVVCKYDHFPRETGLSDHSILVADCKPTGL